MLWEGDITGPMFQLCMWPAGWTLRGQAAGESALHIHFDFREFACCFADLMQPHGRTDIVTVGTLLQR